MEKDSLSLSDELRHRITELLRPLNPLKVIVFGSYAEGVVDQHSDIDLVVVLNRESMPGTYRDRMRNRLLVRRALDALNRDYALDVLVYTRPEWEHLQATAGALSREIFDKGVEV